MKREMLILLIVSLPACNRQRGYAHLSKDFTELDKRAVARVQEMPLGKLELLNSIAAEYTDEETPDLQPCGYRDFEVEKVIRRDLHKIEGRYDEEIHVICRTSTQESGLLRFEWDFDSDLERIIGFRFGFDPSEFNLDDPD